MENLKDWFDYSLSLFTKEGGGRPRLTVPPTSSECYFCGMKFENIDGLACWVERMRHIAWYHHSADSLSDARLDFKLFSYLWEEGIIGTIEYRELGNLRQPPPWNPQNIPTPPSLQLHAIPELEEWHKGSCIEYSIESTKSCSKSLLHKPPPANRTNTLKTASRDYPRAGEVLAGLPYLDKEKEQQGEHSISQAYAIEIFQGVLI